MQILSFFYAIDFSKTCKEKSLKKISQYDNINKNKYIIKLFLILKGNLYEKNKKDNYRNNINKHNSFN
jgi:hypothetical protein